MAVADRVAESVDDPLMKARVKLAGGNLALLSRSSAEARHLFRAALTLLNGTDHTVDIAACYVGLGRSARLAARLETAESCLAAAGKLYAEAGHRHGQAVAAAALGAVRIDLEQFEKGQADLHGAVAALRALGDRPRQATAQLDLGRLASQSGDFATAKRQFEGALKLAAQLGDEALQTETSEQLKRLTD